MYYPYFRGKQYELITIRETSKLLADSQFVPIIEPVKEALGGLNRSLNAIQTSGGRAIVVVNPFHGDYKTDALQLSNLLADHFSEGDEIIPGLLLTHRMSLDDVMQCYELHRDRSMALIHSGFSDARGLAEALGRDTEDLMHVFFEEDCGKLYQRHFKQGTTHVLLRDGFQRRKNRDHPPVEFFSDLHITYTDEGMDGFGDFLIVGDDYSASGGPAYAVAIHITFIDNDQDEAMYVYHFVSDRTDTPTDPAGKFLEALNKLIAEIGEPGSSKVLETDAIREFRELHRRKHFPGLGYAKKLSLQHHLDTLSQFLAQAAS